MLPVSVVIVNYNSGELLRRCLASLREHIAGEFEAVVVDNASRDTSLENLPALTNLKVVRLPENVGFAAACNRGARESSGRIVHFLNPDARVTASINQAYATAWNDTNCIVVTRIHDTRQNHERSSHPLPTLKNVFYAMFNPSRVEEWYIGASVILSRAVIERLGGWAEDYFMYGEDTDLFYRAKLASIPVVVSEALVIHDQGGVTRQFWSDWQRLTLTERSALIFAAKFGLRCDYFVFRHAALIKGLTHDPKSAFRSIAAYWTALFRFGLNPRL